MAPDRSRARGSADRKSFASRDDKDSIRYLLHREMIMPPAAIREPPRTIGREGLFVEPQAGPESAQQEKRRLHILPAVFRTARRARSPGHHKRTTTPAAREITRATPEVRVHAGLEAGIAEQPPESRPGTTPRKPHSDTSWFKADLILAAPPLRN